MTDRIGALIEDMEMDFEQFVNSDPEQRRRLLPLCTKEQVKGLVYNMLVSNRWRKRMSYNDYSAVMDVLIDRLIISIK